MSAAETGGAAFPWCGDLNEMPTIGLGMTLRDYFASKCDVSVYEPFHSFIKRHGRTLTIGELAQYIAGIRLAEADAMLEDRK